MITVNEDLSDYMMFDLGVCLDYSALTPISVTSTGFSQNYDEQEVNNHNSHLLLSGNGVVKGTSNKMIYHSTDTTSGNSGCPVYLIETEKGITRYTVIAIHKGVYNSTTNHAFRINAEVLRFFYNNSHYSWDLTQ